MTSIHCSNTENYDYNDLEKQLPEYRVPSNIGEHFYITIFSGDDMDITNMTEKDTEDTEDTNDTSDDDSDSDIENAKAKSKAKRKPAAAATATNILSIFVTKFLNMINQVRTEYHENNQIMPYSM